MAQYRMNKVNDLLKQEISDILIKELKDPKIGFVSLTDVETSQDLKHAKIYVSVLGEEKDVKTSLYGLKRAAPYIRHLLSQRIRLRSIPELVFKYDESIKRGSHLLSLMKSLHHEAQEK